MKNIKAKFKYLTALAALFVAALFSGIFTLSTFKVSAATGDFNKYPANTKVGYYAKYLGSVERKIPQDKEEGNNEGYTSVFPTYGEILYGEGTDKAKSDLLKENSSLISEIILSDGLGTTGSASYDSMDSEGNLYLKGAQTGRKLYRHDASKDMYYGNVSDEEEAVKKQISYKSRTYGNLITGLYAPAGEVITLEISSADLQACGGLTVFVGQVFSDGSANRIKNAEAYNRMPIIANVMRLTEETTTREVAGDTVTFYFGSYLGGPIYLSPKTGGSSFTVTISGGVNYSHFILGYTTEEEFNRNKDSSAPYFDLEVWDRGVRHSGPKKYAEGYTYSKLYNVASFWEKAASLANRFKTSYDFKSEYGVDFIYDPFITSNKVPLNSLNCPDTWLLEALDYQAIVNAGSNNVLSAYNSRFTYRMGLTNDSSTGDAISLIDYSLYTQISAKRDVSSENEGLEDIGKYSSASLSLKELKKGRESALAVHATVLHSFGQDAFINAVKENENFTQNTDRWFRVLSEATKHDMTYFFTGLCDIFVSQDALNDVKKKNYPMFVPAASVYQTGEVYARGNESVYFKTVQPYSLNFGTPYEIDFDKVLELPYGFSYKIKSISSPANGSLEKVNSHTYTYNPKSIAISSGEIFVKIGLERDDKSFKVEDKILILEFKNKDADDTFESDNKYKNLNNAEEINGTSGFTRFSPDGIFTSSFGVTAEQAFSSFGHIYSGNEHGSALEFTFYGTQFAIYSNFAEEYGQFNIYIDNALAKTVNLGDKTEVAGLAYLSSSLSKGSHTVKITGTSGTFNIDSISLKLQTDPATLPIIPDLTPDAGVENEKFRKPLDHPDRDGDDGNNGGGEGDNNGGNTGDGGDHNNGGQNTPNGGKNYTGLVVGLSVGSVLLIAGGIAAFFIVRNIKKNKEEEAKKKSEVKKKPDEAADNKSEEVNKKPNDEAVNKKPEEVKKKPGEASKKKKKKSKKRKKRK